MTLLAADRNNGTFLFLVVCVTMEDCFFVWCAQDDRTVTSMVPASVRVRREEPARRTVTGAAAAARSRALTGPEAGFGLAPAVASSPAAAAATLSAASAAAAVRAPAAAPKQAAPGFGATSMDRKYQAFLAEMSQLGAV
jgi:hypothetical protein